MELIIEEYIAPTIITLFAIGILYGLYRGIVGFWEDSAGERLASIYFAVMPVVAIYLGIKIKFAADISIGLGLLVMFGIFFAFMMLGRLLFPSSGIFGTNSNDNED